MKLPVRIEIRSDDSYIRFTVTDIDFDVPIAIGHIIIFQFEGHKEVSQIQYVYHICTGNSVSTIVYTQIKCTDIENVTSVFDDFKDTYKIHDFESSVTRPPASYLLYRIIIKLWGKKTFNHNTDIPSSLSGILRALLKLANHTDSRYVEILHELLITSKDTKIESIKLYDLINSWDAICKVADSLILFDDESVLEAVRDHFVLIKSIPVDKLPSCLQ